MDEAQCSSNVLPPFLTKTYEMVDDHSTDSTVSWSSTHKSFIVWNPPEFSRDLLPRYFKHNNFSSFIRQLNTYGFRKIDSEKWEFANDDFIKGQPHLLKNIHRRKPVHSHSLQNLQGASLSQLTESEKQSYKDDIERLTYENKLLNSKLQGHKEEQQGVELQSQALMERLQHMEQRDKNMLSSLAQILQQPSLALNFVLQLDLHDRKRRLPRKKCIYDDASTEDNQVGTSQILVRESLNAASLLEFNKDLLEQLEASLVFWENMVDVGHLHIQQNSSLHIDGSTSYVNSPAISYTQLHVDVGHKTSGIDMNSEPAASVVPEVAASEKQVAASAANGPTGINDGFWEQFLTENPGSANPSEVQSERKDIDTRMNENKPVDHVKFWLNMRSVNNLTEQLG